MLPDQFAVCILTWNHPDLLEERLRELKLHLPHDQFELFLLDNGGSRGPVSLVVSRHLDLGFSIMHHRADQNMGFGGGFNFLVANALAAGAQKLVLISDDVVTFGDWLTPLDTWFKSVPGDFVMAHRIVGWPAGWNKFGETVIPYPEGYFLAMPASTWTKLGGFDTRFHPNDYEDMDLGQNATTQSIPIHSDTSLPIRHLGAGTIGQNPGRYDNTVAMRERFAQKWKLQNLPPRP